MQLLLVTLVGALIRSSWRASIAPVKMPDAMMKLASDVVHDVTMAYNQAALLTRRGAAVGQSG